MSVSDASYQVVGRITKRERSGRGETTKVTISAQLLGEDGAVLESRPFVEIEDGAGYPDGPTVDAEGCLWTGLYGGWAARRSDRDG